MVGVSNGRLTSRVTSKATGRTTTTFDDTAHPMAPYLLTVAIGAYRHYTGTAAGVPLSVWVPRSHAAYAKPLMATGDAMKFLVGKLGAYPFDRVGVVVTPGSSAVETQTMITLGAGNYRYGSTSVRQTIAHELAHAWYGDTVTPDDWRDLWMNEGFATYLEAQYAVSKGWSSWDGWVQEWTQNDGYWRSLYGPPGHYDRNQFAQTNVYNCTALMLTRLRGKIGATAFNSALRAWPQEHLDENGKRSEYVNWLEERTGMELSSFFDTWLTSKTSPA
jgi:aminopeptidase N